MIKNNQIISYNSLFLNKFKCILKKVKYKTYNVFNWDVNPDRIFDIICGVNSDNFFDLKKHLIKIQFNIKEKILFNIYILYFKSEQGNLGVIISPRNEYILKKQNNLNIDVNWDLIKNIVGDNVIENSQPIDEKSQGFIWDIIILIFAEILKTTKEQIKTIEYANTLNKFKKIYLNIYNNNKNKTFNNSNTLSNYYIKIYFYEIKIISKLINKKDITIHDAGTSFSYFPTLLQILKEKELFGKNFLKITTSDICWIPKYQIYKILEKNKIKKNINFLKLDITKDYDLIPSADVTIINDVLEHLPDEETSFNALSALWAKTNKLLIAHVPFDETPDRGIGHKISLNSEKIKNWAQKLTKDNVNFSIYSDEETFVQSHGFLIVSK